MRHVLALFVALALLVLPAALPNTDAAPAKPAEELLAVNADGMEVRIFKTRACELAVANSILKDADLKGASSGHATVLVPGYPELMQACFVIYKPEGEAEYSLAIIVADPMGQVHIFDVPMDAFQVPNKALPKGGARI